MKNNILSVTLLGDGQSQTPVDYNVSNSLVSFGKAKKRWEIENITFDEHRFGLVLKSAVIIGKGTIIRSLDVFFEDIVNFKKRDDLLQFDLRGKKTITFWLPAKESDEFAFSA
jgi:hypothetical protein